MRNLNRFKEAITILSVIAISFMLAACGSSSSGGKAVPSTPDEINVEYTGIEASAVITADNAVELAGQAIGVGHLPQGEKTGTDALAKITNIVVSDDLAKITGAKATTGTGLGYGGFVALADLISDDDFPNISDDDSFESDLILTIDDTAKTATVSGTLTFTDCEHCVGDDVAFTSLDMSTCQNKITLDGTGTVSITFDIKGYIEYLTYFEAVTDSKPSPPTTLAELEAMQVEDALQTLLDFNNTQFFDANALGRVAGSKMPYDSSMVLNGTLSADRAYFGYGGSQAEFTGYGGSEGNYTITATGTMEFTDIRSASEFGKTDANAEFEGYGGYLNYNGTLSTASTVNVDGSITFDYTSDYEEYDGKQPLPPKSDMDQNITILMFQPSVFLGALHYDNTDSEEPLFGHVDMDGTIEGVFAMSASEVITFVPKTDGDFTSKKTSAMNVTVTGKVDVDANLTEAATGQDVNFVIAITDGNYILTNDYDCDRDQTASDLYTETVNKSNSSTTLNGNGKIDYTTTFAIISPVTQMLSIELKDGTYTATSATTKATDLDTRTTTPEAERKHTQTINTTSETKITGTVNISQDDNYFKIMGQEFTVASVVENYDDGSYGDDDYTFVTTDTTILNCLFATNGLDVGMSGTINEQTGYTLDTEDPTKKIANSDFTKVTVNALIINNFVNGMQYMYDNYVIDILDVEADSSADYPLNFAHEAITVNSGDFYNSEIGKVTLVKNDATPFKIFEAPELSKEESYGNTIDVIDACMENKDLNLLFPSEGSLTISGSADTSAVVNALKETEDPALPVSSGYSITFGETTTDLEWINADAVYQQYIRPNWLFLAGTSIAESYSNVLGGLKL